MPFDGDAGKKVGLEIWRIEKLEPVRVDHKSYGNFHTGDCYIVLNTYERKGARYQDLHFWLGNESSQDERGAAAYQTVYLDDSLGGKPVQCREVQGHESQLFQSYFPNGIQYLEGGVASGFRHVDRDAYDPRLFHLKGKQRVRVQQVELSAASLNEGDVYILDTLKHVYQWNGRSANRYEKVKGLETITKIRNDQHAGKAELVVLESGVNDEKADDFWSVLKGSRANVRSAEEAGADEEVKFEATRLFCVSDASGEMKITKIAEGVLERKQLDTNDVFIVDSGSELFVWVGKGATKDEKNKGMTYGEAYLKENNRPAWTPLTRVVEGGEPPHFKFFFSMWDPPKVVDFTESKAQQKERVEVDVNALHSKPKEEKENLVDDGKGELTVWRIENLDKVEVPKEKYGHFHSGDSYIILYKYRKGNRNSYIIYFWQGRDSTTDEKAASALFAMKLDQDILEQDNSARPTQVRVVQNKEPNHFLSLFRGNMVVFQGGVASGFKNRDQADTSDVAANALFHIKGTNQFNTRAVQVDTAATSLNSGDCFLLLTPKTLYVWKGVGANDLERETAVNIGKRLQEDREVVEVNEGEESDAFWEVLGGKADYAHSQQFQLGQREPRLFHVSTATTGALGAKVEEIVNFAQDDLLQDDVYILDAFDEVFVWVGHGSNQEEKDTGLRVALDYVKKAPDGRNPDTPVYRVFAGAEPPNFTAHFLGWSDAKAADFSDPYQSRLSALNKAKEGEAKEDNVESKFEGKQGPAPAAKPDAKPAAAAAPAVKPTRAFSMERVTENDIGFAKPTTKYSYEELKRTVVPAGVDPKRKEAYLSDEDFKKVFGITPEEFAASKEWKQKAMKQKAGLF